ncbi:MAG: sel1 repeat family protein [Nitrosomonadales bacterium]|nr:sel1 repeat family protein [Nitrosomonadales bacterium]
MSLKYSQLLAGMSILALVFLSPPVAFADIAGDMARAQAALDEQDLTAAAKLLRPIAEQNFLPAQVALGELMHSSQENEEAFGWFMMAAYQGDAAAAYNLGLMYASGEGVEQSLPKAFYWIKNSADKNYLTAVQAMVVAYREGGFGLTADVEQAKKWEAKVGPLMAAAKKAAEKSLAEVRAEQMKAYEAAMKAEAARKEAAKKAADDVAAKKVDEADPVRAK